MSGCGCCACLSGAGSHVEVANRPGLSALRYRVGTHATFFEAMIRRLTIPGDGVMSNYSLHGLTTRESDDPAIAFLDAWAMVGDVLTFYEERIANEGFLRTATERRSILELGRLVGYKLKPGVSSSVYLAYTVDDTTKTIIPAGSKSQSIPGADEQPQTFETSEDVEARGVWNALKPRLSKPQDITLDNVLGLESVWVKGTSTRVNAADPLLFVFLDQASKTTYAMRRAASTTIDTAKDRTEIVLEPVRPYYKDLYALVQTELAAELALQPQGAIEAVPATRSRRRRAAAAAEVTVAEATIPVTRASWLQDLLEQILLGTLRTDLQIYVRRLPDNDVVAQAIQKEESDPFKPRINVNWNVNKVIRQLAAPAALAPASQWQFGRSLQASLSQKSDFLPRLVSTFLPKAALSLYSSIASAMTGSRPQAQFDSLHVLRRRAAVFGYNAPPTLFEDREGSENLPIPAGTEESGDVLYLDSPAESVRTGSYVVVKRPADPNATEKLTVVRSAREVENAPRTAYAISTKSTRLTLNDTWWGPLSPVGTDAATRVTNMVTNLSVIRNAAVLTESDELPLAQQPVTRPVGESAPAGVDDDEGPTRIQLDAVVEGVQPGRWVIVSGERTDTSATSGIIASELAMVASIELIPDAGPGGTPYSVLVLAPEGLKYQYKRSTAKIYGNVVKATHGETRNEILGGGDAARSLQTFTLNQTPLTFVSAPTVAGVVSTLAVRVNDVLWHEDDTFFGHGPVDRMFVTKTADNGKVSVIFGNGREGSRVPTGPDNVRAVYRSGIGKGGNVRAGQIATAISRPLGVKDVLNPIAASGGADPESRDDARRNIPVSLQAMGRIVSVQDFADFARTFAGINKAIATSITDGLRQIVHLTVGGAGDIEIDVNSDLYRNLVEALRKFGDPYQPFVVAPREKIVMAGSAQVRVHPDYLWANVAPKIRAKLLEVFSYDRREFAQVIFPAEVIAAIQNIEGVAYVDLDTLGSIEQSQIIDLTGEQGDFGTPDVTGIQPIVPKFARLEQKTLMPAQIAYLPPELADLFILTEITDES
ncbi:MAG TPA: putative baseplate assembly protein [Thermoanaerobaculia bacterium]|nr:putative baseplate assembly protein [Thermoanaerobaculia bacterium]